MPVKGRIQNRFCEIAVWLIIGPHPLSLKSAEQPVSSKCFFLKSHRVQLFIAEHHITDNHRHFYDKFPLFILLLPCMRTLCRIRIIALFAVLFYPCKRLLKFFRIIDTLIHTAQNFRHIDPLRPHAKILNIEGRIKERAHNPHGYRAKSDICLILHLSDSQCAACKPQDLLCDIFRNFLFFHVLHIPSVN